MPQPNHTEQIIESISGSTPPVVVFGIGIPGSGKTTLFNEIGREFTTDPVNVDSIRKHVRALHNGPNTYEQIDHEISTAVSQHIWRGGVALLDSPNCYRDLREADISYYRSLGAQTIGAVWLGISLEEAVLRDSKRQESERVGASTIRSMHNALEASEPSIDEGFDWIVRVN